jgi:hypothetical protein
VDSTPVQNRHRVNHLGTQMFPCEPSHISPMDPARLERRSRGSRLLAARQRRPLSVRALAVRSGRSDGAGRRLHLQLPRLLQRLHGSVGPHSVPLASPVLPERHPHRVVARLGYPRVPTGHDRSCRAGEGAGDLQIVSRGERRARAGTRRGLRARAIPVGRPRGPGRLPRLRDTTGPHRRHLQDRPEVHGRYAHPIPQRTRVRSTTPSRALRAAAQRSCDVGAAGAEAPAACGMFALVAGSIFAARRTRRRSG